LLLPADVLVAMRKVTPVAKAAVSFLVILANARLQVSLPTL
jgi:hypothetical protein